MLLIGRNRPDEHLLNKHVTDDACCEWFALGLELKVNVAELNQIKQNFNNDVKGRCNEMFRLWLRSSTNASWNQLIQALKVVKLNFLAGEIEKLISPVEDSTHVSCDNAGTVCMYIELMQGACLTICNFQMMNLVTRRHSFVKLSVKFRVRRS